MILLLVGAALAEDLHLVREGETFASIGAASGVDPAEIARLSGLDAAAPLQPGQIVRLPEAPAPGQGAVVLALSGSGTLRLPGREPAPVVPGAEVPDGGTFCTGTGSFATLRLAGTDSRGEHDEVTLLGGTCLTVDSSSVRGGRRSSVVSMQSGSISVRETGGAGTVTVRSAVGATSGDAGGFRVTVEEAGSARTEAVSRPVAVLAQGREQAVPPGFGSRTRAGEGPGANVPLLAPPTLVAPVRGATLLRPSFAWTRVEGALAYRVEVSADEGFTDLLVVEPVGRGPWEPALFSLPYRVEGWWWRVTPIDRDEFVGLPAEGRGLRVPAGMGP